MSRPAGLTRFYIGYVLAVMIITALVGVQISRHVQSQALHDLEASLRGQAVMLREISAPTLARQLDSAALQKQVVELGRRVGIRMTVIRGDGVVIADSRQDPGGMDNHTEREEIQLARDDGAATVTRHSSTLGLDMTYCALRIEKDDRLLGYARTALPLTEVRAQLYGLRRLILFGALVLGGLSLLIGVYLMRGATRPLSRRTAVAESEAAEDRERLTAILTSMAEGVIAVDSELRVVHVNSAAGRLFGVSPMDAVGVPAWKLLHQGDVLDCLDRVIRTRTEQAIEIQLEFPDRAAPKHLELKAAPLRGDAEEDGAGAVLVFHDVTRLRHLESVRQDFVANVSHEIKTPLAAAQGMVETMIDDPTMDEDTQTRFLGRVQTQMQRLGNLVNDLLALSRYEGDDLPLAQDELDLRQPVLDAIEQIAGYAQSKSLALHTDLPSDPIYVEGDAEAIRQVFDNLLSNAVRYTPEGGRIEVHMKQDGASAVAEVQDSGIGIDPEHLGRIFERFYRVDKARSRELGGTGLGLSIVKHILVRMNGGVSVWSQAGEGSSFRVHLPLARGLAATPEDPAESGRDEESGASPLL